MGDGEAGVLEAGGQVSPTYRMSKTKENKGKKTLKCLFFNFKLHLFFGIQ